MNRILYYKITYPAYAEAQ